MNLEFLSLIPFIILKHNGGNHAPGKLRTPEQAFRRRVRTANNKIEILKEMIERTKKGNVDFLKKCLEKWEKQLDNPKSSIRKKRIKKFL